jgi:hypothetical protein
VIVSGEVKSGTAVTVWVGLLSRCAVAVAIMLSVPTTSIRMPKPRSYREDAFIRLTVTVQGADVDITWSPTVDGAIVEKLPEPLLVRVTTTLRRS